MDAAIEKLIAGLPDVEAARRFIGALGEKHPRDHEKLAKNPALLSDAATLASFSPLLAVTILQNPEYLWWLNRKRGESGVRAKDELLESLARFALTHSQLEPQVLFARFRRRELLRIYLRDIRRLATVAEITEEISNLADAILESALKLARREMDNRFGHPQETDEKGRSLPSRFCVAALGKLGSRELNYSSDIDLLFLYSNEGTTTGTGSRGKVTNHQYFGKLAEYATRLVAGQAGEGAAYRVDLRLRPQGTLGALALSASDTARYYEQTARDWERQVLIRSRGCAGDIELFKQFFSRVDSNVFQEDESVDAALANVRRSKEKIDLENVNRRSYNVKLGRGGIREIEFIAQALQLAYGGRDEWLRSAHTLISLSRLADRSHLSKSELTQLAEGYDFLRRTEHVLQMENGLQTHDVPDDADKRALLGRRMTFAAGGDFESDLKRHTENVSRIFLRVFGVPALAGPAAGALPAKKATSNPAPANADDHFAEVSPHFAALFAARAEVEADMPDPGSAEPDYQAVMMDAVAAAGTFRKRLAALRRTWSGLLLGIVRRDVYGEITIREAKRLQTLLGEASIAAGLRIVQDEMAARYDVEVDHLALAVLALGKLGGRGLDYDSDLDLIIVYDEKKAVPSDLTAPEFYGRAVEMLVTVLSSMTRDGHLYRVDLRLRPYGSKGMSAMSADAFLEYIRETAAVWEMLAFVKLRAVGGDLNLGETVENETRRTIHERAISVPADELRDETRRVRLALENQRARARRSQEVDIKYGAGGMLDVYFATRYLQLRDNLPDQADDRSTGSILALLKASGSLTDDEAQEMGAGYEFLSTLDHNLRLAIGRTTRVPLANQRALSGIAVRMGLASSADLLEQLTLNRLAVRSAFDEILSISS